jgi:hypothetical protein
MQIANSGSASSLQSAEERYNLAMALLRRAFKRNEKRLVAGPPEVNVGIPQSLLRYNDRFHTMCATQK